jgi:probable rRNA maturation factor
MIELEIAEVILSLIEASSFDLADLEIAAQKTLMFVSASEDAGVTILISDDNQLRQLNQQFLGIDEPTDVLSFHAGHIDPDTNTLYLGDIVISYPRALDQAAGAGHPVLDELKLLVVHGMLHLLGYDHADAEDEAIMWAAQDSILKRLNEERG